MLIYISNSIYIVRFSVKRHAWTIILQMNRNRILNIILSFCEMPFQNYCYTISKKYIYFSQSKTDDNMMSRQYINYVVGM